MSRTDEHKLPIVDGVDPSIRATVDASKRLAVSASGNTTPGDALTNPTSTIEATAYLMAWDELNDRWVRAQIDPFSHNLVTIRHSHHEVHSGNSYISTMVATLAANSVMYCQVTTPVGPPYCHAWFLCSVDGNGIAIDFFENPTTAGGTPVPIYNRNRNSSKVSATTFVHTPTVTAVGTLIRAKHIGDKGQTSTGDRSTEELVLKSNTKYLVRITVDNTQAAIFSGEFNWYEE